MTLEEMDAELRRVRAHRQWLRADMIAELTELLEGETNPYHREFLEKQLEWVRSTPANPAY